MRINPEVRNAIRRNEPVVALESTIISHGMPYPANIETAIACEKKIRERGAVPATIAIIEGEIVVGLSLGEIERIAAPDANVMKVSRRDMAYVAYKHMDGALTVSGTMIAAKMAGIRFFATGGIGGVHRDAGSTMDISADLEELARTQVYVVSAGAKAILDLPKTKEYLETKGVPVIGYQTDELPAFYTRKSGVKADFRFDSPEEIAGYLLEKEKQGIGGGVLIGNPIHEQFAMSKKEIDEAIDKALAEAAEKGITGKEATPFLLSRIVLHTKGESLEANKHLVFSNAELAAKIAVSFHGLEKKK